MYKYLIIIPFLIIVLISEAQNSNDTIYECINGEIKIESDAQLELIQASSNEIQGLINVEKKIFAFKARIRSIKGFNSPLQQEHFYENYMEAEKFPFASFSGKIIGQVDMLKTGEQNVRAKGFLNIHGIKVERIIKCQMIIGNNGFYIGSVFTVPLSDHNISIPKLVTFKIAEEIKVEIEAEFTLSENKSNADD